MTAESLRTALGNLERKKRVLLIDSDEDQVERFKSALTGVGYLTDVTLSLDVVPGATYALAVDPSRAGTFPDRR